MHTQATTAYGAVGGGTLGGSNGARVMPNVARPATDVDAIEEALSFARSVASRVQILADHLLGSQDACGASGGSVGEEIAGGVLPRLAQSARETRYRLGQAMDALDRIQSQTS